MVRPVLITVALVVVIAGAIVSALAVYDFWRSGPITTYPQNVEPPSYGMGGWMMGGCPCMWGPTQYAGGARISIERALELVEDYVSTRFGLGFRIHEIMEFENNFYAIVIESDSGVGAFELLVDPYAGVVSPEPGPNMMWNRKYGMHYSMMGRSVEPSADMPIGPDEAKRLAKDYLSRRYSGAVEVLEPTTFYGYYTMDYKLNGEVHGMLSVNGYTGDLWYHSWHGGFIRELDLGGDEH
ncbi:MAG: hypothetical protein QW663_03175 [Nitrososphaerota archaeon]